ncbi:MAG: DUF3333 domain-containing protein [Halarcobacter ebronensis]
MIKRKNKNKDNPFYDPTLSKRHRSSKRFKRFTLASLLFSIAFLAFFLFDIVGKGTPAFKQAYVNVEVTYSEASKKAIEKQLIENILELFQEHGLEHFLWKWKIIQS